MSTFGSYCRKVMAFSLFVATLSVLPFGALAPTYRIAYLVANEAALRKGIVTIVEKEGPPEQLAVENAANNYSVPQSAPEAATAEQPLAVGGPAPRTHVVARGETLSCIATRYGLTIRQLMEFNTLSNPNLIRQGQVIRLASVPPPLRQHRVTSGENLWVIATRFGITVARLIEFNDLNTPDQLRIGQVLTIPNSTTAVRASRSSINAMGMVWPVLGRITSPFGPRWGGMHTGVDIGASTGTVIQAVRAGRVALSGWWGGYGKAVLIDHGDGLHTLYAHASRLLVEPGDRVVQGEAIARIGSTGNSTGPHLHFEVRVNDDFQNPLNFLPSR